MRAALSRMNATVAKDDFIQQSASWKLFKLTITMEGSTSGKISRVVKSDPT